MRIFLKQHMCHLIDANRSDLSDTELLDLKICLQGADIVFMHLFNGIVRRLWVDHRGYPIQKIFHKNHLLACCVSIRKLAKKVGFGNMKLQKLLKSMEDLNWLYKEQRYTYKNQTVYVLGTWKQDKNENGDKIIIETLFRDIERNKYIKQKVDKPKENDYSNYNFDNTFN